MHAFAAEKLKAAPLERAQQLMLGTAYGYKTLGMPLQGFEQNLSNLTADTFNTFLQEQILPTRLIFCANGLERHEEFAQLVQDRTKGIPPASKFNKQRTNAVYTGGECRMFSEGPSTTAMLCFESVPWSHPDMVVFGVLQTLIGNATGFSMGGPGKGMHCRAIRNGKCRYHMQCSTSTSSSSRSIQSTPTSRILGYSAYRSREPEHKLLSLDTSLWRS